jgi:hypothetical protein
VRTSSADAGVELTVPVARRRAILWTLSSLRSCLQLKHYVRFDQVIGLSVDNSPMRVLLNVCFYKMYLQPTICRKQKFYFNDIKSVLLLVLVKTCSLVQQLVDKVLFILLNIYFKCLSIQQRLLHQQSAYMCLIDDVSRKETKDKTKW